MQPHTRVTLNYLIMMLIIILKIVYDVSYTRYVDVVVGRVNCNTGGIQVDVVTLR